MYLYINVKGDQRLVPNGRIVRHCPRCRVDMNQQRRFVGDKGSFDWPIWDWHQLALFIRCQPPLSRPLELGQTQASNGALVQYYEQVDIRADEWSITTFDLTILPHFRTEFAHKANKDSEIGAQYHLSSLRVKSSKPLPGYGRRKPLKPFLFVFPVVRPRSLFIVFANLY